MKKAQSTDLTTKKEESIWDIKLISDNHVALKVTASLFFAILSVVCIVLTSLRAAGFIGDFFLAKEKLCYAVNFAAYTIVFASLTTRLVNGYAITKARYFAESCILCTLEAFFFNNFLRALETGDPSSINMVIVDDLSRRGGLGVFRYLLVLLIQAALCAFVLYLDSTSFFILKREVETTLFSIESFCLGDSMFALVTARIDGEITDEEFYKVIKRTAIEPKNLGSLLCCIRLFELPILYDAAFQRYGSLISKRRFKKLRRSFKERFVDLPLPPVCLHFDLMYDAVESIDRGEYRDLDGNSLGESPDYI